MTKFTIGDSDYEVGDLTFYQIEKAWPHFAAASAAKDTIAATAAYLDFMSCILEEKYEQFADAVELKKALTVKQINGLAESIKQLLIDNEMIKADAPEGEPAPAGAAPADPSTATA